MYRFQLNKEFSQAMFLLDRTKYDINYKKLSSKKKFQIFCWVIYYKIILKYNNKIKAKKILFLFNLTN